MGKKSLVAICLVALSALAFCAWIWGPHFLQNGPSKEATCRNPIIYWGDRKALDPDRKFRIDVGPYRFAVPWKYLQPRPANDLAECKIKTNSKGLGVQFWVPDGKAPERDMFWRPEFNPPEKDRPNPGPDEWVISVEEIVYYENEPLAEVNPDLRINNLLRQYGKHVLLDKDGDLTLIRSSEDPNRQMNWFRIEPDQSLFFSCLGSDERRLCQGYLDMKDKHLAVYLTVPGRAIYMHATTVSILRSLLQGWELSHSPIQ
jgi:hypothetical protein